MSKVLLRNDHITFATANDITEICMPLNKLGITSFNFVRTFDDGSQINLSNTPTWLHHFYENDFYLIGAFECHPSKYVSGYSLWPQLSGQKIFCDARSYFNIDHGITIIERNIDHCDFYYFGTTSNNHGIINLYLNNLDLLKRFILYFRDKSSNIIKCANKSRILLPDHFTNRNGNDIHYSEETNTLRSNFLNSIPIKKLRLTGALTGETLTQKQINCLSHLIEGKTAKEVAKLLGLSYRTVEGHINKLKLRFSCQSKSELINKLRECGLGLYVQNSGY